MGAHRRCIAADLLEPAMDNDQPPMVYQVWRVDCPCGSIIDYGSDESDLPDACEDCGAPVEASSA